MKTIGAYEAKTHLSKLLERVTRGEQFLITKHGLPLAVLQPPSVQRSGATNNAIAELKRFRQSHALKGLSIKDMILEGRR